jgi:hypothetical protein
VNQWLKLRNGCAGSNLVDMGRDAARDCAQATVNSEAGCRYRWGGHVECLRRRRGDAAGVELDASLVKRCVMNVGTIPGYLSLDSQFND